MSFAPNEMNPYASTAAVETAFEEPRLPGLCKVVFIIDLIFCGLRAPLVFFGFIGASMIDQNDPLAKSMVFELVTGIGIVAFGIPANIGLLMKKGWAVPLGYLLLLATIGSIITGIMQMSVQLDQFAEGSPERAGAMIGAGLVFLIRVVLLGLFLTALLKFSGWLKRQPS